MSRTPQRLRDDRGKDGVESDIGLLLVGAYGMATIASLNLGSGIATIVPLANLYFMVFTP